MGIKTNISDGRYLAFNEIFLYTHRQTLDILIFSELQEVMSQLWHDDGVRLCFAR